MTETFSDALALMERGKYQRAVDALEKVVMNADSRDVRPLLRLAEGYAKLGRTDDALLAFNKAGRQLSDMGFHKNAVAVFKQTLQLAPDPRPVHRAMAREYKRLGREEDAKRHKRAAKIAPETLAQTREAHTQTFLKIPSFARDKPRGWGGGFLAGTLVGVSLAFLVSSEGVVSGEAPPAVMAALDDASEGLEGGLAQVRRAVADVLWDIAARF